MTDSNPIYCAIDRPDLEGAVALARALAPSVGGIKLGLELVGANGPEGVRRMQALGRPIFLDLKLHDIPNTVAGAVRSACALGVEMLTVHVAGGRAMLRAAREAAGGSGTMLLGVTVLTSLDQGDLEDTGIGAPVAEQVLRLADLAVQAGLRGLVCAPQEIEPLRRRFGRDVRLVVPGIRPAARGADDQRRTMTPDEALALGADVLVIGRGITGAADPPAAAAAIARGLSRVRAA